MSIKKKELKTIAIIFCAVILLSFIIQPSILEPMQGGTCPNGIGIGGHTDTGGGGGGGGKDRGNYPKGEQGAANAWIDACGNDKSCRNKCPIALTTAEHESKFDPEVWEYTCNMDKSNAGNCAYGLYQIDVSNLQSKAGSALHQDASGQRKIVQNDQFTSKGKNWGQWATCQAQATGTGQNIIGQKAMIDRSAKYIPFCKKAGMTTSGLVKPAPPKNGPNGLIPQSCKFVDA